MSFREKITPRNTTSDKIPRIVAHRGFVSAEHPENTIGAIEAALETDYIAAIEFDVRRTANGTFVLMHDKTVDRTATYRDTGESAHGRVLQLSLEQITKLNAGDGNPPPTLSEVLREIAQHNHEIDEGRGGNKTRKEVFIDHKDGDANLLAEVINETISPGLKSEDIYVTGFRKKQLQNR